MWIVRLARSPPIYLHGNCHHGWTLHVATPTDIFTYIGIPMVGVIWTHKGMSPGNVARCVLFVSERAMPTTVNNRAEAFGAAGYFLGRS
jgi:hypothetical protein